MKRKLYTCIFALSAVLTVKAQNKDIDKGSITEFCDQTEVEDSDGITKSDYYSYVFFVRSGSEKYTVKTGENYYSDLLYAIIKNTSNKYLWKSAYNKVSGKKTPPDRLNIHTLDLSQFIKQVLPKCILGVDPSVKKDSQQSLTIHMAVNPDTEKVIEVSFSIDSFKPGSTTQNTLFSLPPSKLRQLEELIKGNVSVKLHEVEKARSYSRAVSVIYFKHFEL